jgi:hypothetical protein
LNIQNENAKIQLDSISGLPHARSWVTADIELAYTLADSLDRIYSLVYQPE